MRRRAKILGWSPGAWGAATALAIAVGWSAYVVSGSFGQVGQAGSEVEEPAPVNVGQPIPIPGPSDPLLRGGELTSRENAEAIVGYPVILPSDPLASETTLTEVWVHPGTREVALRFSSGVRVYLAAWPAGKDPSVSLAEQVEDSGVGSVERVGGRPVLILPKDVQAEGFPPQSNVTLEMRGVEISIWGDLTTDELLRIASTL